MTRVLGEDAAALAGGGVDPGLLAALEEDIASDAAVIPRDVPWRDAHVHLGRDRDGHVLAVEGLVADLDRWGLADAVCFPPDDPGPEGQFSAANAAVLAAARRAPGRVVPFCRLDPTRPGAVRAMERAGRGGARGLKLHPVAQRFRPESPEAVAVVREAGERGWPVLIHAGFGARALAGPIAALADAAPATRLILAHGGRGDAAALARATEGRPGILFDTSLATVPDLVALGPGRLVFGSDRPYGEHATALALVGLAARAGGWAPGGLAAVMSGNLDAMLGP